MNDEEDKQIKGVPEFYKTWPKSDVKDWPGSTISDLGLETDQGGCWTGGKIDLLNSNNTDDLPSPSSKRSRRRLPVHWSYA